MTKKLDLNAFIPEPVEVTLKGKTFLIEPLSIKQQVVLMREMKAVGDPPKPEDIEKMAAMASGVTKGADGSKLGVGITTKELLDMPQVIIKEILQVVMDQVDSTDVSQASDSPQA